MTAARIFSYQTAALNCAFVADSAGGLVDLFVDRLDGPSLEGAVFLGRVDQILKDRNAAFIALGDSPRKGGRGLMAAADARPAPTKDAALGALLRSGQMVVVQAKADAAGDKVATLSMDVAFAGRLLAYLPLGRGVMASKRLGEDGDARAKLRVAFAEKLPKEGGWIVRAAARNADDAAVAAAAAAAVDAWRALAKDVARGGGARLLRAAPDPAQRALAAYDAPLAAPPPDFDAEASLSALTRPVVPLEGGGRLIIESAAALTAVDVDGGGRGNPLAVNLAAADALARHLRLRNIGGAVVADFIRMKNRSDQEKLLARLRQGVADDPSQTDVYGMTRLGLVELTRARRGRSLSETLAG